MRYCEEGGGRGLKVKPTTATEAISGLRGTCISTGEEGKKRRTTKNVEEVEAKLMMATEAILLLVYDH